MLKINVDFSGAFAALDQLVEDANDAVRPAAQAGAQIIYDEVKRRVPVGTRVHHTKGKHITYQPGNLRDAIYQAYREKDSNDSRASYHVSWNHNKAFYAFMVEFGTARTPARPFLRPAYSAKEREASAAIKAEFLKRLKGNRQ